jgi:hypothetical protein
VPHVIQRIYAPEESNIIPHSLDVTLREHRPCFEPMTGSLGTTPSIHHQLDSAGCRHGDSSAPACCTLASAPNPDYTRNSPPPLSHCAASFCTVNSKAPGGHGGSNSRQPPPTPALSPLHLNAVLDQEGPAQTSWCSKWAVHGSASRLACKASSSHL